MVEWFGALIQVVWQLPVLVVLIVGIALVVHRRQQLGSRASALAVCGCALLIVNSLVAIAYLAAFPRLVRGLGFSSSVQIMLAVISVCEVLIEATGIGLILGAVIARAPSTLTAPFLAPYPSGYPAGYPHPGVAPADPGAVQADPGAVQADPG